MDQGKSIARTVASGNDRLSFIAEQTKAGFRLFAQHVVRDQQTVNGRAKLVETSRDRGAHATAASREDAVAWIEARVQEATKAGWTATERKAFERKPDAFDLASLPAPRVKASASPAPAAPAPSAPAVARPIARGASARK